MANTSFLLSHSSYPPFTLLLAHPSFLSHPSVLPLHPPILSHSCHTPALLSFHTLSFPLSISTGTPSSCRIPHFLLSHPHLCFTLVLAHPSFPAILFLAYPSSFPVARLLSSFHTSFTSCYPSFTPSCPSFTLHLTDPSCPSFTPSCSSFTTSSPPFTLLLTHPPVLFSHPPSSLDTSYPCFYTLLPSYSSFILFLSHPFFRLDIYLPSLCTPVLSYHTPPSVLTYTFPLFAHRTPLLSFHTTPTVTALLAQYRNEQ